MAKLKCLCGSIISNVGPTNTGSLIPDIQADRFYAAKDGLIIDFAFEVWECYQCGRLGIDLGASSPIKWYRPEDSTNANLMTRDLPTETDR